jgi:hypothetical protein
VCNIVSEVACVVRVRCAVKFCVSAAPPAASVMGDIVCDVVCEVALIVRVRCAIQSMRQCSAAPASIVCEVALIVRFLLRAQTAQMNVKKYSH